MKRILFTASVAAAILMTGCAPKEATTAAPSVSALAGAPSWVLQPEMEGGIAAVGSAPRTPAGLSFQLTEARASGRDELARQIDIKVNNMVKNFTQVTGVGSDAVVDKVAANVSKQVASQTLSGSKQKNVWENPQTGEIYVLMVLDPTAVKAVAKEAVKSSYKNEQALWQQFQGKKAQDELDAAVNAMVK